jgi:hypothetical protein
MNSQQNRYPQWLFRRCIVIASIAGLGLAIMSLVLPHTAFGQQTARAEEGTQAPTSEPAWEPPPPALRSAEMANDPPPAHDDTLWSMLKDFYPERFNQLMALRERDPRKFAQVERQMRPWLHQLREARAQNPELAKLMVEQHRIEMHVRDWQSRYSAANDEQRKALLEEGRQLAETRVNLRLQQDQLRIQLLEKRLHDLKTGMGEREAHKDKFVERELNAMSNPPPHTTTRPAH